MDELILDPEILESVANAIEGYCARQTETIDEFCSSVFALQSEWMDDETFGSLLNEVMKLKETVSRNMAEITATYPTYFRERAEIISSRPSYEGDGAISGASAGGGAAGGNASSGSSLSANKKQKPNSFETTKQTWKEDGYVRTYNSPKETGAKLNCHQGVPKELGGEGVEGFSGTCGLVSCENLLRMAGVDITEAEIVEYASTHRLYGFLRYLCTKGSTPGENGGTYPTDRQKILEHFGISSKIEYTTSLETIANYVGEGRGVIADVDANALWYGSPGARVEHHAITITSVQRDKYTGEVCGFYICDSGSTADDSARFVTAEVMQYAIERSGGALNVTKTIIR